MENIQITLVTEYSNELAESVRHLASVLSENYQPLSDEDIKTIITSETSTLIIALDEETQKIIGMLTLIVYRIPYKKKGWIEDVVVEDAYRGRGIATALLEKAIETGQELGAKTLDLTSQPHREAANRLYGKLGFVKRDTNVYRLDLA